MSLDDWVTRERDDRDDDPPPRDEDEWEWRRAHLLREFDRRAAQLALPDEEDETEPF